MAQLAPPSPRTSIVGRPGRTFAITTAAMFMAQLDNLVVSIAVPSISRSLHTGLSGLQWTVSAYTLAFASVLLTGCALGDRFGRRRLFLCGLAVFTAASVASALAPSIGVLIAARAVQGMGGAAVVPLSLTLLSAAVPARRRGAAVGAWGAIGGLAVALGPVVGGAVVGFASWHWIFWLNVPVGVVLLPLARVWLAESRGGARRLDTVGAVLSAAGLLGVVSALIRSGDHGWADSLVVIWFSGGAVTLAAFLRWEARAEYPMIPLRLLGFATAAGRRMRSFPLINLSAMLMYFGMFGSLFFLSQIFQTVQGRAPLEAGIRMLPWTAMLVPVAPVAGALSDRIGGRRIAATGLLLQAVALAGIAVVARPDIGYRELVPLLVLGGTGMAMFFAPTSNMVLSSVSSEDAAIAIGVNNTLREVGGVLGIAVMGAVFAAYGGYGPTRTLSAGQHFVNGMVPAVYTGAAVLAAAAASMWLVPAQQWVDGSAGAEPKVLTTSGA